MDRRRTLPEDGGALFGQVSYDRSWFALCQLWATVGR